jgi:hypothetical protein
MDLANMREQGVHHLIANCLNDACRHQTVIDVSSYPSQTLVSWFRSKIKCGNCGGKPSNHPDEAHKIKIKKATIERGSR